MEITNISIKDISINKSNRKEGGLTPITSIQTEGILNPVYVKKSGKKYSVVAGNRRVYSAKLYGIEEIPCIIISGGKADIVEGLENLDRQDLSTMDLSDIACKMVKAGYTYEQMCNLLEVSQLKLTKLLKINTLTDEVKDKIRSGDISLDAAAEATVLTEEQQKKLLESPMNYENATRVKSFAVNTYPNISWIDNRIKDLIVDGKTCQQCDKRTDYSDNGLFEDVEECHCMDPECLKKRCIQFSEDTKTLCPGGYFPKGYRKVATYSGVTITPGIDQTGHRAEYTNTAKQTKTTKEERSKEKELKRIHEEFCPKINEVIEKALVALYEYWKDLPRPEISPMITEAVAKDIYGYWCWDNECITDEDRHSKDPYIICYIRLISNYQNHGRWSPKNYTSMNEYPAELEVFKKDFKGRQELWTELYLLFEEYAIDMRDAGYPAAHDYWKKLSKEAPAV